jgi:sugar/nucleoside kinase (ribokinase family)
MMPARTLSIGGATYDLFVRTGKGAVAERDHALLLPLGEKVRVEQVTETCGGGAANTAVGLARLECASHFCGVLGSDQWGERMLKNLSDARVDARCATVVEGETSSFSLILSAGGGERVILYEPGTNTHLHDANFDRDAASTMDWIYLNHIHEQSCVIEDDLIAILKNSRTGFTWNPGGSQLQAGADDPKLRELLALTDLLVCNAEEAMRFTRASAIPSAVQILLQHGVETVCITDGRNGAFGARKSERWHCPIVREAPAVETTGAGDAFGTAATWATIHGFNLQKTLRAGTINAASVIGAIGAQAGLLTDIEMRKRLTDTRLDVDPF